MGTESRKTTNGSSRKFSVLTETEVLVRVLGLALCHNEDTITAWSTVQTDVLQVQGGDQPPHPTDGNSFVACSMPTGLHAPAEMSEQD